MSIDLLKAKHIDLYLRKRCIYCFIVALLFLLNVIVILRQNDSVKSKYKYDYEFSLYKNVRRNIHNFISNITVSDPRINRIPEYIDFNRRKTQCSFSNNEDINVLIAVKSYVGYFDQRLAIRKTWGNKRTGTIGVTFFVGQQKNTSDRINIEALRYTDLVEGFFEDVYENNIFKTLMILKYIFNYCRNTKYVLLVDDDYFVNKHQLLRFAKSLNENSGHNIMFGYVEGAHECNDKGPCFWHYKLPPNEFEFRWLPPHLYGGSIFTTIQVICKLFLAASYVKLVHIDDFYLSVLAKVLNITLQHNAKFAFHRVQPRNMLTFITSHGYRGSDVLLHAWNEFLNREKNFIN